VYEKGHGLAQDYKQAIYWYKKAADHENVDAELNLGVMYHNGQGVPQDYEQAGYWYRKAADQGHATAQFNPRIMYLDGKGVRQDHGQAASSVSRKLCVDFWQFDFC